MNTDERIAIFREMMSFIPEEDIERLIDGGYFTAPASTKYHGNYEGGLFDHSYAVANALVDMTFRNRLKWSDPRSPWVVGMFHDLCKMDSYTLNPLGYYEYKTDTLHKGHGEKSIILLSTYLSLTIEEAACIRYHMGAFTDKEEWGEYTRAINLFPNVLWTHHADMIATHIKGV